MNRILATALVLVVFVAWAVTVVVKGDAPPSGTLDASFFAPVPTAVTAVCFAVWAFEKWLWRLVGSFFDKPVLTGTWRGTASSDWENPVSLQRAGNIDVVAVITQTWSSIVFRVYTKESGSVTTAATLTADTDGKVTLSGAYLSTPRQGVRDKSERHLGSVQLRVDGLVLSGEYFTSRKTTGEMNLERASKKRVNSFDEGYALKRA